LGEDSEDGIDGHEEVKQASHRKINKELEKEMRKNLTKEQQEEVDAKLRELKLTSRNLPDSSMTTYFGKPPFYAYGHANSIVVNENDKYKTHNINPHSGGNKPHYSQIHKRAMMGKII